MTPRQTCSIHLLKVLANSCQYRKQLLPQFCSNSVCWNWPKMTSLHSLNASDRISSHIIFEMFLGGDGMSLYPLRSLCQFASTGYFKRLASTTLNKICREHCSYTNEVFTRPVRKNPCCIKLISAWFSTHSGMTALIQTTIFNHIIMWFNLSYAGK